MLGWGGGGERKETQLASLIAFIGGGCEGEGESREGGEQICPCTRCSLYAGSFTLRLSFSHLRSAVEASFDIKKA